jgi:hypothetical protein
MASSLSALSDQDVAILQDLINIHKGQLGNTPSRPPTERSWDEAEDHQAPEVYIAKPQTSAGIPKLLPTDGTTGTGTDISGSLFDEPGKAECDIYQMLVDETSGDPELHVIGLNLLVHNLSSSDIDQDWILVSRTKFGKWVAIPTALGGIEWAKLDEILYEGETATASIWRGGPKVADLVDSEENVTVGAPPLMGDDDTGTAGESIASGSWVLIERINGYWWVVGAPC